MQVCLFLFLLKHTRTNKNGFVKTKNPKKEIPTILEFVGKNKDETKYSMKEISLQKAAIEHPIGFKSDICFVNNVRNLHCKNVFLYVCMCVCVFVKRNKNGRFIAHIRNVNQTKLQKQKTQIKNRN